MTTQERELCQDLVHLPLTGPRISKEEFLRNFPTAVHQGQVSSALLENAYAARNNKDVSCALIVGHIFGFSPEQTEILCALVYAEWHPDHENVVSALNKLQTREAVEALFHATQWIPEYAAWDDNRVLAVKAIWALGNNPDPAAEAKLRELLGSDEQIIRDNAVEQLERRRNRGS